MSDDRRDDRWRTLPPRTPLEDLVAAQEVPPTAQAIAESAPTPLDEATRHPG
ncbi:hypothetical protein [Thermomonospora cellulosilytica]|uniref:Uncharacterized protein n=1 Tax=Thermomonospora cellulosilytica TaxID=1411118 RepID=A0A7W3MY41_9ACTN|nr:hypothetical protein [Thermomonospora cellulosilytica]MBA9004044.1 hypothetical protein [Thermomonospora cellulosilytica]